MWKVWPWRCKSKANLHKCCIIDNEPFTGLTKKVLMKWLLSAALTIQLLLKREQFNF